MERQMTDEEARIRAMQAEMLRELSPEVAREVYRQMCDLARLRGLPPPEPFPVLYGRAKLAKIKP